MARMRRLKVEEGEGWYHVYSRAACEKGVYPLDKDICKRKFISLLRYYSRAYCCDIAAFCIMGNHYHMVLRFEKRRELTPEELWERALQLYPNSKIYLKQWDEKKWQTFSERLFNLSELMRNIQSAFAGWYNKTFDRHGTFWADRFKSVLLGDTQAVLDCMIYVELNGVRAGLCGIAEDYRGCSFYLRVIRADRWLMELEKFSDMDFKQYRMMLYYRGNVAVQSSKEGAVLIADDVIEREKARGFVVAGMYRQRLRYFVDGVALGGEGFIRQQLRQVKHRGEYVRRINPIRQLKGIHLTLREQRSHAVGF